MGYVWWFISTKITLAPNVNFDKQFDFSFFFQGFDFSFFFFLPMVSLANLAFRPRKLFAFDEQGQINPWDGGTNDLPVRRTYVI